MLDAGFKDAMFEAADKWTSSLEANESAAFLDQLLECCCDEDGAFLPPEDVVRGAARPEGFPEDEALIKARIDAEERQREQARQEAERRKREAEEAEMRRKMEEARVRREAAIMLQRNFRKQQAEVTGMPCTL